MRAACDVDGMRFAAIFRVSGQRLVPMFLGFAVCMPAAPAGVEPRAVYTIVCAAPSLVKLC